MALLKILATGWVGLIIKIWLISSYGIRCAALIVVCFSVCVYVPKKAFCSVSLSRVYLVFVCFVIYACSSNEAQFIGSSSTSFVALAAFLGWRRAGCVRTTARLERLCVSQ